MALTKCPRCELNYIRDDEKICNVCRRQMKGEKDEAEELQNLCAECGENLAPAGQDFCTYCTAERKRRQKLESLMEKPAELEVELTQLDEIDVPGDADIPTEDMQEIHKEFGNMDEEEDEDEAGEDEADDFADDDYACEEEDSGLFQDDEEDDDEE